MSAASTLSLESVSCPACRYDRRASVRVPTLKLNFCEVRRHVSSGIILRSKSLQVSSLYNLGSERSGAGPRVVNREERLRDETKRLPALEGTDYLAPVVSFCREETGRCSL